MVNLFCCVVYFQVLPNGSQDVLNNVRNSIEREAQALNKMHLTVTSGSRLVKEKEQRLRQLEGVIAQDMVRDDAKLQQKFTLFYSKKVPDQHRTL